MSTVNPLLLTRDEIDQRFDLSLYYTYYLIDYPHLNRIILFDGDTTIKGNLDADWSGTVLAELQEDTSLDSVLILINGNLTVEGDIRISEYHLLLLVLGNVHCEVLENSDDEIHITGDAHIKYVFYGYYNKGTVDIKGTTYVPYVLNENHRNCSITPEGAILINLCYSDHRDIIDYDYTREVLAQVIIPAAFNDEGNVEVEKFIDIVKSGQSPFIEGVRDAKI
jgi:hypothetical protein